MESHPMRGLSEQIQEDLRTVLDGLPAEQIDAACQVVVDRFKNSGLKSAITSVIEYNWARELADYCENRTFDPEEDGSHIFNALVTLDQFVYYHNRTADDFADEA
jgi:hypothetical protein